jgi:hypothetical protein
MKTVFVIAVAAVVAALAVPAALAAEPSTPSAYCKNLKKTSPLMFGAGATYKTLGACVAAQGKVAAQSTANAAKACKAEQADANFAAGHGGKSFAEYYGGNDKAKGAGADKNAFGKCVSAKAKEGTAAQQSAQLNAAKQCKAQRADAGFAAAHGGKTFAQYYGKNGNLRNAFGKCVSTLAKAQPTS